MMSSIDAKTILFVALGLFTAYYIFVLARGVAAHRSASRQDAAVTPAGIGTGVITDFLDTLGIGSFATTTSIFRFGKLVPDELIPGTLNVGHTLPTIAQAFIYTRLVPVEGTTLIAMIIAAVIGAWLGAGVVSRWPRRTIQAGMALCLFAAASLMLASQLGVLPAGGELLGVTGSKLVIAAVGNFVLGALMTLGIGLYAPCLILVSLLGMNPTAGFPIMMGSCAFLMPISSARFIRERKFHVGASLGLLIGGLPAVFVAAFIVKSLPLTVVRWLVIAIVVYTAATMIRAATKKEATA